VSNSLAIAATTTTLRNLLMDDIPKLDTDLSDLDVTTRTLEAARTNVDGTSLNLFLYRTVVNVGWSNLDMPRVVKPGEAGFPPLSLNLQYLVTAFGRDAVDQDAVSHRILGAAMSVLHDHPLLGADEIRGALTGNDLADQLERIRITPLPLSVDEMSKLWGAFQSQYRLSAAYEVTVVLIDSHRPPRAALPVLTRGQDDRGVVAVTGGSPVLRALVPPRAQAAVRLGEEMVVDGNSLTEPATVFRFVSMLPEPMPVVELARRPLQPGDPRELVSLRLPPFPEDPDALGRWVPGFYLVTAAVDLPDLPPLVSNAASVALAPTITVAPNVSGGPTPPGAVLTLTCSPRVRKSQRARLLFGDRQLEPTSVTNPDPTSPTFQQTPTTLTFDVPGVPAGTYTVRLRVDGVDSIPVVLVGDPAIPAFDPAQQVEVS
jgi:hypothetical protein